MLGRLPLRVGGVWLRVPVRFWSFFVDREYEPVTDRSLDVYLRSGMTVIDVGAHIGYFAVRAGRAVGPSGHVVALEPSAENARLARENVALNGLANVEVRVAAASGETGRRSFHLAGSSDSNGFYAHPLTHTEQMVEVDTVRLDDLISGPVHAVKIDVEGAELEVIDGMDRVIEDSPDLTLWVEWNPACLAAAGHDPLRLPERLGELGFAVTVLDDGAGRERPLDEVAAEVRMGVPPSWYVNILARRLS